MNILFTCAGRRNYLINYFKEALQNKGKIFASDMQTTAPALIDADVAIQVPAVYDDNYIPTLIEIVEKHNIKAIISLNDLELPILSKAKKQLEKKGAKVIVADDRAIDIAFDKWKTVQFLEENGLKTPLTFIDFNKAKAALKEGRLKFPLVVKPRWGSASIGIVFPEDMHELELAYELQKIQLKRSILAEASKEDINHAILIQEKIPGQEYGLDVLNDFEGNYIGTFARKKLQMRSGETDKAISVKNEKLEIIGRIIGENLKHIGNLDADAFEYKGEFYVLELNPRFGGGYPFSHEAGMNTAAVYIEWLRGNKNIDKFNNYKADRIFAKCDRMMKIN